MSNISKSEVIATIETALAVKAGSISETTQAKDVASWDSLGQLSVLVALDKLYSGKIAPITTMAEADSIPKILAILKQHSLL